MASALPEPSVTAEKPVLALMKTLVAEHSAESLHVLKGDAFSLERCHSKKLLSEHKLRNYQHSLD